MSLRRTKKSRKTDMLSLSLSRGQVLCSKVIPFYCPFLLASASSQCFGIQHLKTIWTYYDVFLSKMPGPIPFFSVSNSRHWCILKQSAETVNSTQPTILLKGTASLPWWNSCWLIWTLVQTRCDLSIPTMSCRVCRITARVSTYQSRLLWLLVAIRLASPSWNSYILTSNHCFVSISLHLFLYCLSRWCR